MSISIPCIPIENERCVEEKLDDDQSDLCTLCEENEVEIQLTCGHSICKSCLAVWITEKIECPWCRAKIDKFLIRILPVNVLPIIPSESEMCEICCQLLTSSCLLCSMYKVAHDPIPTFDKCDCVKLSCECIYHRHCIGYFHLQISEDDNVSCPRCKK